MNLFRTQTVATVIQADASVESEMICLHRDSDRAEACLGVSLLVHVDSYLDGEEGVCAVVVQGVDRFTSLLVVYILNSEEIQSDSP